MKPPEIFESRRAVSGMWICTFLLLIGLEFLVFHAQVVVQNVSIKSLRFYFVPIMLTLPFSTMFSFHRESVRSGDVPMEGDIVPRISYVLAVSALIAYVTLLCCMGACV